MADEQASLEPHGECSLEMLLPLGGAAEQHPRLPWAASESETRFR